MVWGCIILGQKGPLIVLEYPGGKGQSMNSERYREQVLEGVLLDFHARMKAARGSVTFQQDNAPSHKSKATKRWFASQAIPLLFHPSSSPDLNPIEPVWHELKARLRTLPHPPNTVEALKDAVYHVWDELPVEDIDKHIRRMPDRVTAVLAAKGGHTQF
ncbi:putative encoded by [Lyophyllum shimeji]|uniref:Encoded by n=1 Tax=Lyophyllum shimeji TaxID=47721 RepID=A0A9P3PZG6_LYOSH|nr:putative encoded by [Lyophyllum shimeji]